MSSLVFFNTPGIVFCLSSRFIFLLASLCCYSCFSRRDNFQLVVLDKDDGGIGDGAGSKPVAAENARKFLRDRLGSRKHVSYSLLKARKRLGPSPNF